MSSHFYAMLSRMKYINRWGLMRNTRQENLSEHSLETALIAHALAIISNNKFGGSVNADKVAVAALFHDTTEIITGDLPTPIKYYNPQIKEVYKDIEKKAEEQLLEMLPDYMKKDIGEAYSNNSEIEKFVKAADKISAYIKCVEEIKMGNEEFKKALKSNKDAIEKLNMPEVQTFMKEFIPSYSLSLDEQR